MLVLTIQDNFGAEDLSICLIRITTKIKNIEK